MGKWNNKCGRAGGAGGGRIMPIIAGESRELTKGNIHNNECGSPLHRIPENFYMAPP